MHEDGLRRISTSLGATMAVLLLGLPTLVYYFWFCLAHNDGQPMVPQLVMLDDFPLPTASSVMIVAGWLVFQGILQILAPGRTVEGTVLRDGTHLTYKLNGWFAWWFTLAVLAVGTALGLVSPTIAADQLGPLLTTANMFAYPIAAFFWLYGKRFQSDDERVTGNAIGDFWFGTALNPRVAGFDVKFFCESRVGLIAWVVIDLSLAAKQYELHGMVTVPMVLVCAFQFWYVADCFLHEEAILTTWDIKHENFGWMLCWGNLVWLPFTYTIQAQYLVHHIHDLPFWGTVGVILLNAAGYAVFRGANLQKHRFRKCPERPIWGAKPEFIATAKGPLLLASGWWGLARHVNYLGDLLMALAWCLPCLFASPIPYFYVAYLIILLVHRERRDHDSCKLRYGKDWDLYCLKVPYRIVPGLY